MNTTKPTTPASLPPMQAKSMSSEVFDSFYELFLYEALEQLISQHQSKQSPLADTIADIEQVGMSLGRKIIDLLIREMQVKFQVQLDVMKFICTEFWKFTFSKAVDNLRTNNAGTFIMTDEAFKFIARVSGKDHESKEYKEKIRCYEAFIVGMIRGAIVNLGFDQIPPQVSTQIKDARLQLTVTLIPQVQ